jgi:hypothetical protein
MATTTAQQVLCPVCHQADQVMKAQKAYERGVTRLAPPVMPVARVGMIRFIIAGFALVLIGVFFILIWSGTVFGGWPMAVQVTQATLTIIAIVAALVLSFIAFQRVVQGDLKSQKYLPAYDEAVEKWSKLSYCKRDDVVFDAQTSKTISDAALRAMLTIDTTAEPQAVAVSH